jgi:TolA-binding protein
MSLKPPIIAQDQLVEQTQHMSQQKDQLENSLDLLQHKLEQIEHSIGENDHLKTKVKELMDQSLGMFQTEWKRRFEFYPEIRLKVLEKTVALVAPAAAPGAAAPGVAPKK